MTGTPARNASSAGSSPDLADVTVVVTSHDAGAALEELVADLLHPPRFGAVHLVDSGSTDGSPDGIETRFPGLRVSRLEDNPGPSATRNLGLRNASTTYVLFLDDDMRLDPAAVRALRDRLEADPGLALAGPAILHEGGVAVQYQGGCWHYAGLTHMYDEADAPSGVACEVDVVTSGCVLARRVAVLDAGGFWEPFWFLMEDVELSLRLRWLGWRLAVDRSVRAWNRGGSEGLSLVAGDYPARRVRLHARNRPLLLLVLYDWRSLFVLAPGILLLDAAFFAFALRAGHPLAFLRGRLEVIRLLPAAIRRRRGLVARKRLSDRALLGAPALTITPSARRLAPARRLQALLEAALRGWWRIAGGLVR